VDFLLWHYVEAHVFVPLLPAELDDLKHYDCQATASVEQKLSRDCGVKSFISRKVSETWNMHEVNKYGHTITVSAGTYVTFTQINLSTTIFGTVLLICKIPILLNTHIK